MIQQIAVSNGQGLTGWVARNRRPLVNARPSADLEAAGLDSHDDAAVGAGLPAGLQRPVHRHARGLPHRAGVLHATITAGCSTASPSRPAAVIHNSIVFEQTQEDSLTDPLTGLPNTRFMFMHLTRELARAERLKSEVSLLVMDLDNFKDINDTHGHHVGDRALREVARVLRAAIRPYDICVRYAGDEFIVVLSGCGARGGRAEARRAADERSTTSVVRGAAGQAPALGVSIGAAVFPHDGDSYEALLATADSRMYQDKAGRKRRTRKTTRAGRRSAPRRPPTASQRSASGNPLTPMLELK